MQIMASEAPAIPQPFVWRRLHSLFGLWLVIFLIEHLFVNSQAALWIGNDGKSFIDSANALENWPYLQFFEVLLLGLPIFVHTVWGIKYLLTAKYNSFGYDGKNPYLPQYSRNHAYTWQRITSWLLVVGILAHVIHMRFVERPMHTEQGAQNHYLVRVDLDQGLPTLADRINVKLYDANKIKQLKKNLKTSKELHLKQGEVIAVADNFGAAELLMVRETFKNPIMLVLYTLFVLTAIYHAFNGLWTFLITWGVTLSQKSQKWMLKISTGLMVLVGLMGLSAIWLTYWINLKN